MPRGKRRRQRRGILPLLIPAAVLAAEATKRKKKQVGNISRKMGGPQTTYPADAQTNGPVSVDQVGRFQVTL